MPYKQGYRIRLIRALGEIYGLKIAHRAVAKAERWMIATYGGIDWEYFDEDTGDAAEVLVQYAEETKADPTGLNSYNRKNVWVVDGTPFQKTRH